MRNTVLYHRHLLKRNKASISSRRHRLTRSPHCLTDPLHASPSQVRGQLNRPQGRNRTPTSLGCQCATATHVRPAGDDWLSTDDTREKKGRTASNAPHHGGTPAPTPLTPRRGREGPSFFRLSLPCGLRMEAGAGTARKSDYEVGKPGRARRAATATGGRAESRANPSRRTSRGQGHWVMAAEEGSPSRCTWA